MSQSLHYLASPYSHPDPVVKEQRAQAAIAASVALLHQGIFVYSPIAAQAAIAGAENLPGDWMFWKKFDECFIDHCDTVIVLTLDGWKESIGVQAEIEYAKNVGMLVSYRTLQECSMFWSSTHQSMMPFCRE